MWLAVPRANVAELPFLLDWERGFRGQHSVQIQKINGFVYTHNL